jgi:GNAT superfamily N-acetyltransferase
VRLAVLSDDRDVVLGFSVSREDILDYVHVHKDMRKQGVATSLIPKDIKIITHLTKTALLVWPKYENITFNPFI